MFLNLCYVFCLSCRAPFSAVGASDSAIEAAIQCGSPAFPSRMSEPAADFIAAALDKQPDRRPSILQMLHHGWIRSFQVGTTGLCIACLPAIHTRAREETLPFERYCRLHVD